MVKMIVANSQTAMDTLEGRLHIEGARLLYEFGEAEECL